MIVVPRNDCAHVVQCALFPIEKFKAFDFTTLKCDKCTESNELWICLKCASPFCGRYVKNHFFEHYKENQEHCICISTLDLSVWCYKCSTNGFTDPGSYIESPLVSPYLQVYSDFKFGTNYKPHITKLSDTWDLSPEESREIKYQNFIELLKNKQFKRSIIMTGAGISTSAGIPDFRSESGMFQQIMDKYQVSSPIDFLSKQTFLSQPEIFYNFCKSINLDTFKPTITHYFIKYWIDKGIVQYNFTQNIDGLELKAGISEENIVFAHGSTNEGHCAKCNESISITEIKECMFNDKVKYCPKCNGPCKPKIVWYGEQLLPKFYEKAELLSNTEWIIIMGTSLTVEPFSSLPEIMNVDKSWIVVINWEEVGEFDFDDLANKNWYLPGKCDERIKKLWIDCEWWDEFKTKYPVGEQ